MARPRDSNCVSWALATQQPRDGLLLSSAPEWTWCRQSCPSSRRAPGPLLCVQRWEPSCSCSRAGRRQPPVRTQDAGGHRRLVWRPLCPRGPQPSRRETASPDPWGCGWAVVRSPKCSRGDQQGSGATRTGSGETGEVTGQRSTRACGHSPGLGTRPQAGVCGAAAGHPTREGACLRPGFPDFLPGGGGCPRNGVRVCPDLPALTLRPVCATGPWPWGDGRTPPPWATPGSPGGVGPCLVADLGAPDAGRARVPVTSARKTGRPALLVACVPLCLRVDGHRRPAQEMPGSPAPTHVWSVASSRSEQTPVALPGATGGGAPGDGRVCLLWLCPCLPPRAEQFAAAHWAPQGLLVRQRVLSRGWGRPGAVCVSTWLLWGAVPVHLGWPGLLSGSGHAAPPGALSRPGLQGSGGGCLQPALTGTLSVGCRTLTAPADAPGGPQGVGTVVRAPGST